MQEKDRAARDAERDAFWDIDALIPPRRAPHYTADTEAVEISIDPLKKEEAPSVEPVRHYIPPHKPVTREAESVYVPEHSLIRSVTLYRQPSPYPYYEDFVRDAGRLYAVKGIQCPHAPFFSYVPQYSQMDRAQLEWYLWWRECFRRGEILTTDYSYILLYAYEILNLPNRMEPLDGQRALFHLWCSYRELFHQLDGYLPEWICDYSLIHRLPPPEGLSGQTLSAIMAHCRLREFYVSAAGEDGLVRALVTLASDYDYQKSKFYTKENAPLYDRLIFGALAAIGKQMSGDGRFFHMDAFAVNSVEREAYRGALCAHRIKYRIAIQYASLYCSSQLRLLVTELIKYTENRIRASLGIRARLSIYSLTSAQTAAIDAYLLPLLPQRQTAREAEAPAEYEKHYDLPRRALSLDNARRIESDSWDTTERLVEAFEEEVPIPVEAVKPTVPTTVEMPPNTVEAEDFCAAFRPYLPFLEAVLAEERVMQRTIANAMQKLPDALADEINELAADAFGDILLEADGDGYVVVEDYLDTAERLIKQGKDNA